MLTTEQLHDLRRSELEQILKWIPTSSGRLLEIGAGDGLQASTLSRFFEVCAVDVAPRQAIPDCKVIVDAYDGYHLPFNDASFDVVFSSHALEHIAHIEDFQAEIRRVLRSDGYAIHVMPSASWRLWTIVTHYLDLPARVFARLYRNARRRQAAPEQIAPRADWHQALLNGLIERRHGERGSTLTELYLFSRFAWRRLFRNNGFGRIVIVPLGLFYTGFSFAGKRLSLATRRKLARWLGSSSILYIVHPDD